MTWDSIGFNCLVEISQNSGKHLCLLVYYIIKDLIKDIDEEVRRVRSGRVPITEASVPMELGCVTLCLWRHVHQPGSSLNSTFWGFLWTPHLIGIINGLLDQFPALSLLWRMGVGAENSKLVIIAWSFW